MMNKSVQVIKEGNNYRFKVAIPMSCGWIEKVYLIFEKDGEYYAEQLMHEKNEDDKAIFSGVVNLNTWAVYHYYFGYMVNGELHYIKNEEDEEWKLSVNYEVPDWAQGKIMYHIFVDRFYRGSCEDLKEMKERHIHKEWNEEVVIGPDENGIWNNDFYGGDLKGIIAKLDYIQSLGVTILYLSPIVYSQSTHRYDTADYEMVDPYAGCNEDLKLLCEAAHHRGMKVILDAVFNHTGNDSKYFNEFGRFETIGAYQSKESKYFPFYRYNDGFDYWWGMKNLPVCNCYAKEWQDYITGIGGVIDKWFDLGIDGLRLDVADELSDEFIELIHQAVRRNKKDGFILGEVWKNPMRMGRNYLASGRGMDSVMNYNLVSSLIKYFRYGDVTDLAVKIREIRREYPDAAIYSAMNFTSTHDMTRGINLWQKEIFNYYGEWPWNLIDDSHDFCRKYQLSQEEYEEAKKIYMAYVLLLAFMPGNLSIFYGDEIGMQGVGNLKNRGPFPWKDKDTKLLEFFKVIGQLRNSFEFMTKADIRLRDINEKYIAFERIKDNDKIFVAVNRTSEEQEIMLPEEYQNVEETYKLRLIRPGLLDGYGGIVIKKS